MPVSVLSVEEGPSYGATILAMVGAKEYTDINEAVNALVTTKSVVQPNNDLIEKYEKRYRKFQKLYPALKDFFCNELR